MLSAMAVYLAISEMLILAGNDINKRYYCQKLMLKVFYENKHLGHMKVR